MNWTEHNRTENLCNLYRLWGLNTGEIYRRMSHHQTQARRPTRGQPEHENNPQVAAMLILEIRLTGLLLKNLWDFADVFVVAGIVIIGVFHHCFLIGSLCWLPHLMILLMSFCVLKDSLCVLVFAEASHLHVVEALHLFSLFTWVTHLSMFVSCQFPGTLKLTSTKGFSSEPVILAKYLICELTCDPVTWPLCLKKATYSW